MLNLPSRIPRRPRKSDLPADARLRAALAIAAQIELGEMAGPGDPSPIGLAPADAALAFQIYRGAMRHRLALEHLLDAFLSRNPVAGLEPRLQGVLLAGAAQLLLLDRVPVHAVVDQGVEGARRLVRAGAAGLTNAVLRRVAEHLGATVPYSPGSRMQIPLAGGWAREWRAEALPDPAVDQVRHLAVAYSHPPALVAAWLESVGEEVARRRLAAGLDVPPTRVTCPVGFDPQGAPLRMDGPCLGTWEGTAAALGPFLARHPACLVQDPAAALAVASTAKLPGVTRVLDACAGRGTKSRQLRLVHPDAEITVSDADPGRMEDLRALARDAAGGGRGRLLVKQADALGGDYDLVVLDVPCSNTGVLSRRVEARWRYSREAALALSGLQCEIARAHATRVRPGGWLLWSTCSLEHAENGRMVQWLQRLTDGEVVHECVVEPAPAGADGHGHQDGGYHALLRLP